MHQCGWLPRGGLSCILREPHYAPDTSLFMVGGHDMVHTVSSFLGVDSPDKRRARPLRER
jgi:hypothetical protein